MSSLLGSLAANLGVHALINAPNIIGSAFNNYSRTGNASQAFTDTFKDHLRNQYAPPSLPSVYQQTAATLNPKYKSYKPRRQKKIRKTRYKPNLYYKRKKNSGWHTL